MLMQFLLLTLNYYIDLNQCILENEYKYLYLFLLFVLIILLMQINYVRLQRCFSLQFYFAKLGLVAVYLSELYGFVQYFHHSYSSLANLHSHINMFLNIKIRVCKCHVKCFMGCCINKGICIT